MASNQFKCFLFLLMGILYLSCEYNEKSNDPQTGVNPQVSAVKENLATGLDKSPMDMSYYPPDYPKLKMSGSIQRLPIARVIYSRPKKDGRIIFGNVVKYGTPWRLGANEATEIEFFEDVTILNKRIKKNRYVIYCKPFENSWTLILNNDLFTWGLKIDSTQDMYSFDIPIAKTKYPFEVFTMEFQKADTGMHLVMAWDSVKANLPIKGF